MWYLYGPEFYMHVCVVLWCRSEGKVCGICMVLSSICMCVFLWCRSEGKVCGVCMVLSSICVCVFLWCRSEGMVSVWS